MSLLLTLQEENVQSCYVPILTRYTVSIRGQFITFHLMFFFFRACTPMISSTFINDSPVNWHNVKMANWCFKKKCHIKKIHKAAGKLEGTFLG